MSTAPKLEDLRRYAIARSLFPATTLLAAIRRLGFVQADPIRAPARAQDLTLRHRVKGYRAGDLERRYERLPVDEDYLVNYGFLPSETVCLLQPRQPKRAWDADIQRKVADVLAFVRERGEVHPRELEQHLSQGRVQNYWGGSSRAGTQLLNDTHYCGLLRVKRRDSGTRIYALASHPALDDSPQDQARRATALIDLVVSKYAPLPASSLAYLVRLLDYGAPHLSQQTRTALNLTRQTLSSCQIAGTTWYWPSDECPASHRDLVDEGVRLLAPFDPIVWDRARFSRFWNWDYKLEAYTPAAQRRFGYYALPMLWHDQVIGWANVTMKAGRLDASFGYATGTRPGALGFKKGLDQELQRMEQFLASRADTSLAGNGQSPAA